MIYRAYKFEDCDAWSWDLPLTDADGENRKIYYTNSTSLAYADSGAVSTWSIDEDYMVNNNSTIGIAKATEAVPGEIVVLIKDSGAYDMGVITAVDNEKLQITYKPMTYLLDVSILNPMRLEDDAEMSEDGTEALIPEYDSDGNVVTDDDGNTIYASSISYQYNAVTDTARILASIFCTDATDKYLRLPLRITTSGSVDSLWSYTDDTVSLSDWIKDIFDNLNVVLQFGLTFETSRAYITILVAAKNGGNWVIKDNVAGMDITHTEDSSAKATVCHVLDKSSKALLGTFYLYTNNTTGTNAECSPKDESGKTYDRVQPYKVTTSEVDLTKVDTTATDGGAAEAVELCETAADNALLYSDFNHYISLNISRDSKMYPDGMELGDSVTIVPEILDMTVDDTIMTDYSDYVWDSIYTGRKEKSSSTQVTLVFGKIRINYTDLVQMTYTKKAGR